MFNRVLNKPLIKLLKANDENNSGVVNEIMSKLLTLSKFVKFFSKLFPN